MRRPRWATNGPVDFLTRRSAHESLTSVNRHEVLMIMRGHWRLVSFVGEIMLNPGDTCALPPGFEYAIVPAMEGEASLFRVRSTDDAAGPTGL